MSEKAPRAREMHPPATHRAAAWPVLGVVFLLTVFLSFREGASQPAMTVELEDQTSLAGILQQCAGGVLHIEVATGQTVAVELARVRRLLLPVREDDKHATTPASVVGLIGGNQLQCDTLELRENAASFTCQLAAGTGEVAIPAKCLRWIRFRPLTGALAKEWKQLISSPAEGDRVIVAHGDFLDFYPGSVVSIKGGEVTFRLDDELVRVPADRLAGIIFAAQPGEETVSRTILVEHRGGSQLRPEKLELTPAEVTATIAGGVSLRFAWEEVKAVEFESRTRIALLALPVVAAEYRPPIPLPGLESDLARLLLPAMGSEVGEAPQRHIPPLRFPAGAVVQWNLPAGACGFRARVTALDKEETGRSVEMRLRVDGAEAVSIRLLPDHPREISAEWQTGKTLELMLSAATGSNFGLFVELEDAVVLLRPDN